MGVKGSLARLLGKQTLLLIPGAPTLGPHLPVWTGMVTVPVYHLQDGRNHELQPLNHLRVHKPMPPAGALLTRTVWALVGGRGGGAQVF